MQSTAAALPTRRVLVVDDQPDVADMLVELVNLLGSDARAVYYASSVLDAVREFRPDLVLLDMTLSDGDGASVGRELRANCDYPLRLVALTGYARDHVMERVEGGLFDEFVTKPCTLERLRQLLQESGPTS